MADLFVNYKCTNCQDDITGIRVHCAECTNFDLCLQCFAAGAEIGEHRNNHAYQFMDTGTAILSIFRGKGAWSAREELRLLDAIEQYGFGNWEDISKHIETRSAEDAKEEYVNKYLNGTIGRHTWTPASESQRPKLQDHTSDEDNGPLGANTIQKLPPLDITAEEAAQLGYMPNRDGFEREYDPTAEQLVSSLKLNQDDVDVDIILLKLAQVDIYTRRLRERARRKRLVRDFQLVANFFRDSNKLSKYTRDQREFRDRFRVFAQFYTAYEYERLLASLDRERELRIRLSELSRYRWNGLTRIDECIHFEKHAAVLQHNTGPYGHGKTDNQVNGNQQGSFSHLQHNKRVKTNENEKSSNFIAQKFMRPTEDQIYSEGLLRNKSYLDNYRGSSVLSSNQIVMTPTLIQHQQTSTTNNNSRLYHQIHQQPNENIGSLKQQQLNQISSINNNLQQQQKPRQLSEDLLTTSEIELCLALNLPPTCYITLKTLLLCGLSLSSGTPSQVEISIRKYLNKAEWLKKS